MVNALALDATSLLASIIREGVDMSLFSFTRNHPDDGTEKPPNNQSGAWVVITVLLLLLVAAGVIAYFGWTISNADVPISGYVAMALGVIFSLAFGVGLMALVFYSSRKGYDEPAVLIQDSSEANELETRLEQKR